MLLLDRKRFMCDSNESVIISDSSTHTHAMLIQICKIISGATCRVYEAYNYHHTKSSFHIVPIIFHIFIEICCAYECAQANNFTAIWWPHLANKLYIDTESRSKKNSTNRIDSFHSDQMVLKFIQLIIYSHSVH